jgi:hypothetical protein
MNRSIVITRTVVIAAGVVQLVLGLLFWADIGKGLVPVHAAVGIILVLSLLALTFLCARAGAPIGLVVLTVVWSLAVPAIGLSQKQILVGSAHWIIQVVHLLLGLGAMGLASIIAARVLPREAKVGWDARDATGS